LKPDFFSLPAFGRLCACLRRSLVVQALAAVLLVGSASPASAQGFQGMEPGQTFDIDVKSGVIQDPLPFDVHFYLRDKVDDTVRGVEGRVLGFKTAQTCEQALKESKSCPPSDKAVVDCHSPQKATPKGDPGKRTFELLVTPLQPNRYYCFQISQLLPIQNQEERTRIQNSITAAVATELSQGQWLQPKEFQTLVALEALRRSLVAAAETSLGSGKVAVAEDGSLFDLDVPVAKLERAVGEQLADILMAQSGVIGARDVLRTTASKAASGALQQLSESPLWGIVVAALKENAGQPRVAQLLAGRQPALDLIGLSPSEIVARSEGHTGTLDQIWDPAQINVAAEREKLAALQTIATGLRTDDGLRQAAGLDEPTLRARVDQACISTNFPDLSVCSADPVTPLFFQRVQDLINHAVTAFDSDLEEVAKSLQDSLSLRARLVAGLSQSLQALLLQVASLRASTVAAYETRATWYVGADLGTALAWDIEEAFTYAGANIYFRPVNKKAHLTLMDWRPGQRLTEFRKRFSVMFGLPQNQIDLKNAEPLVQSRPVLVGAGIRLSDFLRFTFAGALVFKEKDPNPLVDNKRLAWSPFVGLSIDWNIAGTFRTMFRSVFPGGGSPQPTPAGDQ
jgi:hypothetical protein